MEHTEKYLQAKWVTENPDGYDERDVVDAKKYCNAYLDGYNQALRIHDVSESVCELCNGTEIFNPFDGMELPCACTTKIVEQTVR